MHPLTANVTNLIMITGVTVVLSLVVMVLMQFVIGLARNLLENL